jgi:hypothetical protein
VSPSVIHRNFQEPFRNERIDKKGNLSGDLKAIEPLLCNSGAGCMMAMIAQGVAFNSPVLLH